MYPFPSHHAVDIGLLWENIIPPLPARMRLIMQNDRILPQEFCMDDTKALHGGSLVGTQRIFFKDCRHHNPRQRLKQAQEDNGDGITPIIHRTEDLGLWLSIRTHIRTAWDSAQTCTESVSACPCPHPTPPVHPVCTCVHCMCVCVLSYGGRHQTFSFCL